MGCDNSKPGRTDIPIPGAEHDFDVRPHPKGDTLIVADGQHNKWFQIEVDDHLGHLRHNDEVTAEQYQLWKRQGKASVFGPLGIEPQHWKELKCLSYDFMKSEGPILTVLVGPAAFEVINDEDAVEENVWELWWKGQEFEQMTWVCTRELEVKTEKGRTVASIRMRVVGTARVLKQSNGQHGGHAKFHHVEYNVQIDNVKQKVHKLSANVESNQYERSWTMAPDRTDQGTKAAGCMVQCHMIADQHCVSVRTAELCLPLGGLCVGVGMATWMHPLTTEKLAAHFAYDHMQECQHAERQRPSAECWERATVILNPAMEPSCKMRSSKPVAVPQISHFGLAQQLQHVYSKRDYSSSKISGA